MGYIEAQAPQSPQDIEGLTPGKTFEKKTLVADADRKAGRVIVMGRAEAHAAITGPMAAKPADQVGAGDFELGIRHG